MIDAAVLAALAHAVALGGDPDLAQSALRRVDPLLRGRARRRLREACADADLATRVKEPAHVLRLAYLLVAGAIPARAARDDVEAIARAFEEASAARPPARPAFWWPTALALVATGGVAIAGGFAFLREARPPAAPPAHAAAASAPARPPRGVFASGGVPAPFPGAATLDRALGTDLPAYFIALDRWSEGHHAGRSEKAREAEVTGAAALLRTAEVRGALGEPAAKALDDLLDAAQTAAKAPALDPASDQYASAISAFDDALAGEGLPYFADGDVLSQGDGQRRLVLLYVFRVERVTLFDAGGGAVVRALHLRRLDKLNWSHALLGFTRPTLRNAAVLLDQLDEQAATLYGPALAPGAALALFDPDADDVPERRAVEARAGELVRAELGTGAEAEAKLGQALGRRRELIASWEKRAAARGMALNVSQKLALPEAFATSLAPLVPAAEIAELATLQETLVAPARLDAFTRLRDALVASVERHEAQHRLDATAARQPMPKPLEAHVGPLADEGGKERRGAATSRAELSAYLAELARDARAPRVGLAMIARFLFDKRMHGTPESYAALTIFEELGKALDATPKAPILARGRVDRRAVAEEWLALASLPPDRLRDAAKKLWETLFAAPLVDLSARAPRGDHPG